MKKLILSTLVCLFLGTVAFSHPINNYKYVVVTPCGNSYNIEDELAKAYQELGFSVIGVDEAEALSEQKALVLYASYEYSVQHGQASELTVVLADESGKTVYKSMTNGLSISPKMDMKKAVSKMLGNMKKLNYRFAEQDSR